MWAGLLQGALALTGYVSFLLRSPNIPCFLSNEYAITKDAVAHMIEGIPYPDPILPAWNEQTHALPTEIPNPSKQGPPLMIYAVLIGTSTGFAFLTTLLFCMRDINDVIKAAEG